MQHGKCKYFSLYILLNAGYLTTRLSFALLFANLLLQRICALSLEVSSSFTRGVSFPLYNYETGIKEDEHLTIVRLEVESFLSFSFSRWLAHCFASPCFNLHPTESVLALYALFYRLSITSAFTFVFDATRFENRLRLSLSIQTIGIDWAIVDLNISMKSSPSFIFDTAEAIDCCTIKAIIAHENVLSKSISLYRSR